MKRIIPDLPIKPAPGNAKTTILCSAWWSRVWKYLEAVRPLRPDNLTIVENLNGTMSALSRRSGPRQLDGNDEYQGPWKTIDITNEVGQPAVRICNSKSDNSALIGSVFAYELVIIEDSEGDYGARRYVSLGNLIRTDQSSTNTQTVLSMPSWYSSMGFYPTGKSNEIAIVTNSMYIWLTLIVDLTNGYTPSPFFTDAYFAPAFSGGQTYGYFGIPISYVELNSDNTKITKIEQIQKHYATCPGTILRESTT
jgi:hypothetical protein